MIKIAHLYYDLMNLYGDNGNIKALKYQIENQGVKVKIDFLTIGDNIDFKKYDLFYIGPGTADNQKLVLKDLLKYKNDVNIAIENNKFFLITGNAIELFGKNFKPLKGKKVKTLESFNFEVKEEEFRLVDEVVAKSKFTDQYILGFQNQNTVINNIEQPVFDIIKGIGIYPGSKREGIHRNNFFGTYLIGPILVRNPELLKLFVKRIVLENDNSFKFKKFDLKLEQKAHEEYIKNYYQSI